MVQDVLQQHEGVLALAAWQRHKSRRHMRRDMDNRKIGVRQARGDRVPRETIRQSERFAR